MTYVRFVVLPPANLAADASAAATDAVLNTLQTQAKNAGSKLRTEGSFVRRLVPTEGALNIVTIQTLMAANVVEGTAATSQITSVDPFGNLDSRYEFIIFDYF